MRTFLLRAACLAAGLLAPTVQAAFGVTSSGGYYTVDTGAANSLVYKVSQSTCDITSLLFIGVQYQYASQFTHISSGLGSGTSVSATTISSTYIKITCVTSTLTQYIVAKSGDSNIYMATYITAEPTIGELRFIARLDASKLTTSAFPSSYSGQGSAGAVEGSDVYYDSAGNTYSKFYSSVRFIDDTAHWVSTSGGDVHVTMVLPGTAYETSSGGPFHRDINTDRTSTTGAHNLYFYMNSGHSQTEAYRTGLNGPYALCFSRSGIPVASAIDTSFFADLGITGYVAASGRGKVTGSVSGLSSSYQRVLHWYNSAAQYWVYANSAGAFTSPLMKPGTYTMVLYKNELAVGSKSVSVSAGGTTSSSISATSDPASTTPTWIIGDFDGKPAGFLNADLIERRHPSDPSMHPWGPITYTVGSSSASSFPMAQFKSVNSPTTIKFTLTSSQTGAATLKIATTWAFAGGRPQATVNGWAGPVPAAPTDLNSRGVTRGTWRGNNMMYTVSIPSGTLVAGSNTITLNVVSGSSGTTFLSPNFIYDAVALYASGTAAAATTTTTTKAAAATTTTTTGSSGGGTVAAYGQCGGSTYTGATVCVSGYTCVYSNDFYSQCVPS